MAVDLDVVYALINKRDRGYAAEDKPEIIHTQFNYSRVVKELMSKPKVKAYSMPIFVRSSIDPVDKKPFIDVCLLNPRYVIPPKGAKPWGGKRGQKMPKGKYNINLSKYNRFYSIMGIRWSKLIDTQVQNEAGCSNEQCVANILWELTFDGWTEEKAAEKTAFILDRIKEAEEEIKKGNCITLPPKEEGGMKIVVPDIVSKQLMDIVNKVKTMPRNCKTCYGCGLWPDGTAPMGPMDASDGMPTIACPECGANPNPSKKL
jgi:hypothetical protein